MSESDNLIPSETNKQSCVKCLSCLCLQSKAAILIILWTVFIGAMYAVVCIVIAIAIKQNQHVGRKVDSVVTNSGSIFCSILAKLPCCIRSLDTWLMPVVVVSSHRQRNRRGETRGMAPWLPYPHLNPLSTSSDKQTYFPLPITF